jgi:hypothetical protein
MSFTGATLLPRRSSQAKRKQTCKLKTWPTTKDPTKSNKAIQNSFLASLLDTTEEARLMEMSGLYSLRMIKTREVSTKI